VSARPHSDGVVRVHPPAGAWRRRQKKSHLLQASYRTTDLLSLIGEGERSALDYLIKSRWGAAGGTSQCALNVARLGRTIGWSRGSIGSAGNARAAHSFR